MNEWRLPDNNVPSYVLRLWRKTRWHTGHNPIEHRKRSHTQKRLTTKKGLTPKKGSQVTENSAGAPALMYTFSPSLAQLEQRTGGQGQQRKPNQVPLTEKGSLFILGLGSEIANLQGEMIVLHARVFLSNCLVIMSMLFSESWTISKLGS